MNINANYHSSDIPVTRAQPDLAFCLPVRVQLNHTDYARLVNIALHGVALWIVMALLPWQVALPLVVLGCCSLRYGLFQQALLYGYRALVCDQTGQWYLVTDDRSRQWIALEKLQMPGPLLFLKFRHFGGTVFWMTFQHRQAASHWGRLRALCRFV